MILTHNEIHLLKYEQANANLRSGIYSLIKQTYDVAGREFTAKNLFAAPLVQDEIARTLSYLPKNSRVIDAGCGAGIYTVFMGLLGYKVTGIDISSSQISSANENNHLPNINFFRRNILDCSFYPESVDFFLINSMFHYILKSDRQVFLRRIGKALRANGKILLITRSYSKSYEAIIFDKKLGKQTRRYVARSTQNELDQVLRDSGFNFEIIYTEPHENGHEGVFIHYLLSKQSAKI